MREFLGSIKLDVYAVGPDGELDVEHETSPSPVLAAMQGAMSNDEKRRIVKIRSELCRGAGVLFAQWRQPETDFDAAKR